MANARPLIEAKGLSKTFSISQPGGKRVLRAVRGIDLTLTKGEAVAIVGESGCGKSTLARMLLGLLPPSEGSVHIDDRDVGSLGRLELAGLVQPVFQDPFVSLNPAKTTGEIIGLPLTVRGMRKRARQKAVDQALTMVGLPSSYATRRPRQMSGGERQRVSIARALVAEPRALICDEPTSALDVSVQAQVLNLLRDLRESLNLTYLVITHNLAVVDHLCERTVVMYFGRVVEEGPTHQLLSSPRHPYTRMLRNSVLEPGPDQHLPEEFDSGVMPDPLDPPAGCPFRPRCPRASERCAKEDPPLTSAGGRKIACHHPLPFEAPDRIDLAIV